MSTKPVNSPEEKEYFEVDSALLSEIGEKLVTTPHVALSELVKNAYDADATEVCVSISYDENHLPRVEIQDNGHGMTRDAVHQYWMRIGTTNKVENDFSPLFGRQRTGAKGIGRFACRRLGSVLELETCSQLSKANRPATGERYQRTQLIFHWSKFTPGSTVSSVPVQAETESLAKAETGLKLVIYGAKDDEWSFRGFSYLKRQLAGLCANQGTRREGYKEDPGFRVVLNAPDLQEEGEVTDIREQLMNAGWGTLTARIDEDGHAICSLVAKTIGKRTVRSSQPFTYLKDIQLRLAIFPIEREWLRDTSAVSKSSVMEICNNWGGVQVRFRGFRVYPYGEDDWIEIEKDRARRLGKPTDVDVFDYARTLDGVDASRSLLNMLGMKNYFGSVDIGPKQDGFEAKADRMGFVEDGHFRELKNFVRFAIDWSMVLRDYAVVLSYAKKQTALRQKLIEQHQIKLSSNDSSDDAVRIMRSAIQQVVEVVPQEHQAAVQFLSDSATYLESSLKIKARDLIRLRLVASASTLTLLFAHEIKSLTSTFASVAEAIKKAAKSVPVINRKQFELLGSDVSDAQKNLAELLELTHVMGVSDARTQPVRLDLRDAIARAVERFEKIKYRYNIEIHFSEVPEGLQVGPMLEGELLAIVINVLSNAIKAVIAGGVRKTIEFKANRVGQHVKLDVYDSGVGLSEEYYEDVFTPMISDPSGILYEQLSSQLNPEDRLLLGSGTGLGLSIVRGILEARHGNVEVLKPTAGWRFHLRMDLP